MKTFASLIMALLGLSSTVAFADDPICGLWRFFNNTMREMRADGTSSPQGKKPDATWQRISPPQTIGDINYVITYGGGQAVDRLMLRNGNQLIGSNRGRPFITASRIQPIVPRPSPSFTPQPEIKPRPTPVVSAEEALINVLIAHEWTWRDTGNPALSGTIIFNKNGSVAHVGSSLSAWRWASSGPDSISITPPSGTGTLVKFNPERSEFVGEFATGNHQLRGLRGKLIGSSSPAKPVIAQTVGAGPDTTSYGGMALSKDWMPRVTNLKIKELEEIEFFAKHAVGEAAPGKEPAPDMLVPQYGLRWLMPLNDAVKQLPRDAANVPLKAFQNDGFPHGTLMIKCLQLRYFNDLDQQFNLIYLIADAKQQLVGVQFKSQAKGLAELKWETLDTLRAMHPPYPPPPFAPPPFDGSIGPYNDFFAEGRPGAGYQLRFNNNHSLTLVKLGKVHWYLAAPFARCLLDIADHHRKSGLIK